MQLCGRWRLSEWAGLGSGAEEVWNRRAVAVREEERLSKERDGGPLAYSRLVIESSDQLDLGNSRVKTHSR